MSINEDLFEHLSLKVRQGEHDIRLDKYLSKNIEKISRTKIQNAIKNNNVSVNKKIIKSSYRVKKDDNINIIISKDIDTKLIPENIPINIVYEDESVIVINKDANMVVHPGIKNETGTLANALLFHINRNNLNTKKNLIRPGIVHRIDKDTTGLMIAAKDEFATEHLAKQFFNRTLDRRYLAFSWGVPKEKKGQINTNIGRDIKKRTIMSVFAKDSLGKKAITSYEVIRSFSNYMSFVSFKLHTGRTHQIRVHFKHIGNPLFNDKAYGGDRIIKGILNSKYKDHIMKCFKVVNRQALHSNFISFDHPYTKERLSFEIELPNDMKKLLELWNKF